MVSVSSDQGPELYFGLVSPVGTDNSAIVRALDQALHTHGYLLVELHLSDHFEPAPDTTKERLESSDYFERTMARIAAGNYYCEQRRSGDAIARLAIGLIRRHRQEVGEDQDSPLPRVAYLIRSFKRVEEVAPFKRIYGSQFFLIGAHAPLSHRLEHLKDVLRPSQPSGTDLSLLAEELVKRDHQEPGDYGQNVRETYPLADIFVSGLGQDLEQSVRRFVHLLFNGGKMTPTADEYAMALAYMASFRSSHFDRRVGAAIAVPAGPEPQQTGDVIALGMNEVPRPFGGHTWPERNFDTREVARGFDSSTKSKRELIEDTLKRLASAGWLTDKYRSRLEASDDEVVNEAVTGPLRGAEIDSLLEFQLQQHAEMSALSDAVRRGVAVQGCNLYTTTYPCHLCTKEIIAAGITRVVYIEDYPKSRAESMYPEAVGEEAPIAFEPFVGVRPERYVELFGYEAVIERGPHGEIAVPDAKSLLPKVTEIAPTLGITEAERAFIGLSSDAELPKGEDQQQ